MARLLALIQISAYFACAFSQLLPETAPDKTQAGQSGTNKCGTDSNQSSMCQNAFLNAVDDFCLYAPPSPGPGSVIGNTERIEVSWCMKSGRGTRLIPDGTISGAHFIQTPDFVQITGIGDLTRLNVPAGDEGGELDPHGADGNGNPIGALVFSSAFGGKTQQIHEWTNFMSDTEFCFRACKPGPRAATLCQHIYDVMGCHWNMPGDYNDGFDSCKADSGEPMGVYGSSTFFQGQPVTPPAHPPPASSGCAATNTIANGVAVAPPSSPTTSPTTSKSSAPSPAVTSSNTAAPLTVTSHALAATMSSVGQPSVSQNLTASLSQISVSTPAPPNVPASSPAPSATNTVSSASKLLSGLDKLLITITSIITGALVEFFLF